MCNYQKRELLANEVIYVCSFVTILLIVILVITEAIACNKLPSIYTHIQSSQKFLNNETRATKLASDETKSDIQTNEIMTVLLDLHMATFGSVECNK